MQNIQGVEDCYEIDLSPTAYRSPENVAIFHFNLSQGLNDVFLDGSNFQREICFKKNAHFPPLRCYHAAK